ncbi:A24 family peptidase [Vibrio ziniensis]|uniref:Prepilin type IV endopeptidase peptidase domain-containing protein n=1 Tax=Vibrio ziniensis TaxID=2711221 RepID=A0A6G7CFX1_9VIBR|nr:prepilin peptidase [Vibrio ziniensis]QIH40970.1 hypothetical protein G5S32_02765 [Vibrio ziniensis]
MLITIWVILVIVGVFDAREYRIPNSLVLLLVVLSFVASFIEPSVIQQGWLLHIAGFVAAFFIGLIFYVLKIMAAGDVKLFGVLGLMLGLIQLPLFAQYLAVSCVFIGGMYWLLNRLELAGQATRVNNSKGNIAHTISIQAYQLKDDFKSRRNLAYMPFAPVLIVALAMYHYFHG